MFLQKTITRLRSLRGWLKEPRHAGTRWLGGRCAAVAWLGLALALLSPPQGPGVALCWFESSTGLPCPGCGMTRSLACAIRGRFAESWQNHPMGLIVLLLFLLIAGQSLLPKSIRNRIAGFIEAHAGAFNATYLSFVVAFVTFGVLRMVIHFGDVWVNLR
jgi:hypothetical protein